MNFLSANRMASGRNFEQPQITHGRVSNRLKYQTFPATDKLREVMQEAMVNEIMGFGRQFRETPIVPAYDGVNHYEMEVLNPFSTPSICTKTSRKLSDGHIVQQQYPMENTIPCAKYQEDNGRVNFIPDPEMYSFLVSQETEVRTPSVLDGCHIMSLPSSLSPDSKYDHRSSSSSSARLDKTSCPDEIERPLTPYPDTSFARSSMSSRDYSSVLFKSSQRQPIIQEPSTTQAPITFIKSFPHHVGTVRRPRTLPIRLPADYRSETAFSFNRPTTPTPFSMPSAPIVTPAHRHYNATRVGGVELEYHALERAARTRTGMHRTMWPEERWELSEEVDIMAKTLPRNQGIVKAEDTIIKVKEKEVEDGIHDEKMTTKKKKIGWLKRLFYKRKKVSPELVDDVEI
jgi:hypothetical protein